MEKFRLVCPHENREEVTSNFGLKGLLCKRCIKLMLKNWEDIENNK